MATIRSVLQLDMRESYVLVPPTPELQPVKTITIEAWIRPTLLRVKGVIIAKGDKSGGYAMDLSSSGRDLIWTLHLPGVQNPEVYATINPPLQDRSLGKWSHLAMTFDGSVKRTLVDGVVLKEVMASAAFIKYYSNGPLTIGSLAGDQFVGYVAEVRVWNIGRSSADIKRDMLHRLQGTEDGLVGYWPLDEGSGLVAKDLSKYHNPGRLSGARWATVEFPIEGPRVENAPDPKVPEKNKPEAESGQGRWPGKQEEKLDPAVAEALKARTACKQKIEELEKQLDERAGKCAADETRLAELEKSAAKHRAERAAVHNRLAALTARLDTLANDFGASMAKAEGRLQTLEEPIRKLEERRS